jgi:hypothetical protein
MQKLIAVAIGLTAALGFGANPKQPPTQHHDSGIALPGKETIGDVRFEWDSDLESQGPIVEIYSRLTNLHEVNALTARWVAGGIEDVSELMPGKPAEVISHFPGKYMTVKGVVEYGPGLKRKKTGADAYQPVDPKVGPGSEPELRSHLTASLADVGALDVTFISTVSHDEEKHAHATYRIVNDSTFSMVFRVPEITSRFRDFPSPIKKWPPINSKDRFSLQARNNEKPGEAVMEVEVGQVRPESLILELSSTSGHVYMSGRVTAYLPRGK